MPKIKSSVRTLAEAIIMQAIDDLWNPVYSQGSLDFFRGEEFYICADIAGISNLNRLRLLNFLHVNKPC